MNLILRLYDIQGGRILIDGQDVREVTQDSLRRAISMISQDPMLFHRSLFDNIRYGSLDATDDEVQDAARSAHAHEFIAALPQGYESLVGERGVRLSGGQRQRVAIARAVLKNAPIFFLDEATSSLDSVTERHIQNSIAHLLRGRHPSSLPIGYRRFRIWTVLSFLMEGKLSRMAPMRNCWRGVAICPNVEHAGRRVPAGK